MEFDGSFEVVQTFTYADMDCIRISAKNLHKKYNVESKWYLKPAELELEPGEPVKWVMLPLESEDNRFVTNYIPSLLIYGNCISSYSSGMSSHNQYDEKKSLSSTFEEGFVCFKGVYDEPVKYIGILAITADDNLRYTEMAGKTIWYGTFHYTKDISSYLLPINFPYGPKRYFPTNMTFAK